MSKHRHQDAVFFNIYPWPNFFRSLTRNSAFFVKITRNSDTSLGMEIVHTDHIKVKRILISYIINNREVMINANEIEQNMKNIIV